MNPGPAEEQKFGYRVIYDGEATGFLDGKGSLRAEGLQLGDDFIPFDFIGATYRFGNRVMMVVEPSQLSPRLTKRIKDNQLVLDIKRLPAAALKQRVDNAVSRRRVKIAHQQWEGSGNQEPFRSEVCPQCDCTLDLGGKPRTDYLYCEYCEITMRLNGEGRWEPALEARGATVRTCDSCGLFGRIKAYTVFNFYFLLVVYGFSSRSRFMCDTCADRTAIGNFFTNLIFVLGVPAAVILKIKTLAGRGPLWKTIARANKQARKGNVAAASPLYDEALTQNANHPGLLYNKVLALLQAGDVNGAGNAISTVLRACSNYQPALRVREILKEIPTGTGAPTEAFMAQVARSNSENPLTTHT